MSTDLQTSQASQTGSKSLYKTDFVRWVDTTVKQLQAKNYGDVDWENLIEEVADMSRRERKRLKSNLIVVLLHLLKWHYQPNHRSGSWKGSIREHRRRMNEDLNDSPSLRPYFQDIFAECYASARDQVADETGLPLETFPMACPYSPQHSIDPSYLPWSKDGPDGK